MPKLLVTYGTHAIIRGPFSKRGMLIAGYYSHTCGAEYSDLTSSLHLAYAAGMHVLQNNTFFVPK